MLSTTRTCPLASRAIRVDRLVASPFSIEIYGDPDGEIDDLLESIRRAGILEPLIVARADHGAGWEVLSGHRRLSCARRLGWESVPCLVRSIPPGPARQRVVLDSNRQRVKTFSQRMREADALETLLAANARQRRQANLRRGSSEPECRNSDDRGGRTDTTVARAVGLGGKDLYRQARAVSRAARAGDLRAAARSPSSTPAPRPSTPPTRTCAAAIASPPASAPPPTMSGPSAMTAPTASPTPARSRPPSSPTPSTTSAPRGASSSIPWPAVEPPSMSAPPWVGAAWPTTSNLSVPISDPMTSAPACPPRPPAAT